MLHTPIANLHVDESSRSSFRHYISKYTKRRRWVNKYQIFPPADRPFLPSNEALASLVRSIPDVISFSVERCGTHDMLTVFVPDGSIFAFRASWNQKQVLQSFLRDLEQASSASRGLSQKLSEDCDLFLANEGFVWMSWNGRWVTAYTPDKKRYEGRLVTSGPHERGFRRIERACRSVGPFEHGVAPW